MWGLTGPEFLELYWLALGVATLLAMVAALWAHRPRSGRLGGLGPYEVAMLAGGPTRVMHTALAGLVSRGAVHVSRSGQITQVPHARAADHYESAVLAELRHGDRVHDSYRFQQSPVARDLARRMVEAGYLKSPQGGAASALVKLIFVGIGLVGAARLVTGLMNDRPIGWLALSLVATLVIAKLVGAPLKHRSTTPTRHGRQALSHAHAHGVSGMAVGAAILLPVAFAGLVAYPDPEMSAALNTTPPPAGDGGSSSGGGDSGSSGCGSGGGSSCGGSSCGGGGGCGG
ncbi:TIGR04222 domain-containing membrane protein [Actinokineospora sp. 24-640]